MKFTTSILLFLSVYAGSLAQRTISQTTTLAIKYLEGQAGNYPNSLFVRGITNKDDEQTTWGIKPNALCEGCRGEVGIANKDGYKTVVLVREFSTLDDAEQDMYAMIDATRKVFPSLKFRLEQYEPTSNEVEEKEFTDETRGIFHSIWVIMKQPDAEIDKQFILFAKLEK